MFPHRILLASALPIFVVRSDGEIGALQKHFAATGKHAPLERRAKEKLNHIPKPLTHLQLAAARTHTLLQACHAEPSSSTQRAVARNREMFVDSVFCFNHGECLYWKKLCLAKCQPFITVWLPLVPLDLSLLGRDDFAASLAMTSAQVPCMAWTYDVAVYEVSDPFTHVELQEVAVVMLAEHFGHEMLVTSHTPVLLDAVLRSHAVGADDAGKRSKHAGAKSHKVQPSPGTSLHASASCPDYVVELDASSSNMHHASGNKESDSDDSSDSSSAADEDDKHAHVYAELEADRLLWSDVKAESDSWFNYGVSGGSWQMIRTGRATYGPRVSAKKGSIIVNSAEILGQVWSQCFCCVRVPQIWGRHCP
eukprot:6470818-Amphidinium_carterae.2